MAKTWRELQPGDQFIEKDSRAFPKTVIAVVPDQYIRARGLNERTIPWKSLGRYRIMESGERAPMFK